MRITRITACILRIGTQETALRGGVVAGLEVIEMGCGLAIPLLPGEALAGAVRRPGRAGASGPAVPNLFAKGQVVVQESMASSKTTYSAPGQLIHERV
ncbi:MAG: hypothetical protein JOY85_11870 [Acidobacteriaceae bacterium]|nr:hypothetical protein [Acidobacteriaceae bacterium]